MIRTRFDDVRPGVGPGYKLSAVVIYAETLFIERGMCVAFVFISLLYGRWI